MTVLVDYGAGNLRSVQNTLEKLGAAYQVTNKPEVVSRASKLVLPGVGHFGPMMCSIDDLGLRVPIVASIRAGNPFLGICAGLQCLFETSEESAETKGLGIFSGSIKRFSEPRTGVPSGPSGFTAPARIPHMGWNTLSQTKTSQLLKGLAEGSFAYFAHSYYAPVNEATVATCTYIHPYTAVLEQHNIYAVQFHPEKSGPTGLHVMHNFLAL